MIMKNNPIDVGNLTIEIFKFDHTYFYSDDYRVWKSGEIRKQELIDKANGMNLSKGDKIFMIEFFLKLWNSHEYWSKDGDFALIDEKHIQWVYKSSMYKIAGITKNDLQYSHIQ